MATLRSTTGNFAQNGADVIVTLDAGASEDDLALTLQTVGQGIGNLDMTILDPTSTYTEIADLWQNATGTGEDINVSMHYAVLGATPDTTVQMEGGGSANDGVNHQAMVWDAVEPSNPLDVTPTTDQGVDPSAGSCPSITTVTDGAAIIYGYGAGHWQTSLSSTIGPPTGYTQGDHRGVNDSDDALGLIGHLTGNQSSAGAEDPGVFSGWSGDDSGDAWACFTVALRNEGASPGGGPPPAFATGGLRMLGVGA